jgi:SAM-dependent methyltransferase
MSVYDPPRTELKERPDYNTFHPSEQFMVSLLRENIESALDRFAVPRLPGSGILDIGCGSQPFRRVFEAKGYRYTGLDTQQTEGNTVHFVCPIDGPLPQDLLEAGPFDFILCTEVFEHVADWDTAFANIRRLTDVGGRVLVTCPFFYYLHEEPYDFWRPTRYALKFFAAREGFSILEQKDLGTPWDVLGTLLGCTNVAPASGGPISRLAAGLMRLCRKLFVTALRRGWIQKRVKLFGIWGNFYLSNLIVLERD